MKNKNRRETDTKRFRTTDLSLLEFLFDKGHQPIEFEDGTASFDDSARLRDDVQKWDELGE